MIDELFFGLTRISYELPLWVAGLIIVIVLLGSLEIGFRFGIRQRGVWPDAESGGGNYALTSMLAIMGLMLAFTYAAGTDRNEKRKQNMIVEANALGTAFHHASLADEPGRTELKNALLDYARTRTQQEGVIIIGKVLEKQFQKSTEQLDRLWPITEEIVRQQEPLGLKEFSLVAAVISVIDVHTIRLAGAFDRLPIAVLWLLSFIIAVSLSVTGFNAGISGRISRWRMTALTIILSGIILVIMDFDRPNSGLVRISQASINDVIDVMEADLAE